MGDNRETEIDGEIIETQVLNVTGSVLILPVREAIFFLLIFLISQVVFLGVTAWKFDRLERNIERKWEILAMDNRGRDIQRAKLAKDLTGVVDLTVRMWGTYFEEIESDVETEKTEDR
jgi:hypothetical protein